MMTDNPPPLLERTPDENVVFQHLRATFADWVTNVRSTTKGRELSYIIEVPPIFSREKLEQIGIQKKDITRKNKGTHHDLFVRVDKFPQHIQHDAYLFLVMGHAGISMKDAAYIEDGNDETKSYSFKIPGHISRDTIAEKLGINRGEMDRKAIDLITHRITINLATANNIIKKHREKIQNAKNNPAQDQARTVLRPPTLHTGQHNPSP